MTGASVALVTCAAALVPGLGHVLLGMKKRGLAFFFIVSVTLATGLWLRASGARPADEYGKTYVWTAGLMNLLLVLDTLDRSAGRRA